MDEISAVIFDFDGVIAESEAVANILLVEHVSRLRRLTTV